MWGSGGGRRQERIEWVAGFQCCRYAGSVGYYTLGDCEAFGPMTENAEFPENVEAPAQEATHGVQDSAADFLREYIGVLNSAEFGGAGADMSEDTSEKFAAGLYQKYIHEQRP